MRGKFNGSVLSKFRTGFNAYNRGLPRRTPTHTQLSRRSGFTVNANNWKSLSPADRQAWNDLAQTYQVSNRIGELTNLSGYAYFMRVQQFCHHNGIEVPIPPDAGNTGTLELDFTVEGLEFESSDAGFSIILLWIKILTSTTAPSGTVFNISISNPMTPSQEVYTGTYYFVGRASVGVLPEPPVSAEIDFTNVIMPVGWYSFNGARHRVRYQSVNPYTGQRAVTKYNDGIAQEEIPSIWPQYEYIDPHVLRSFFIVSSNDYNWKPIWYMNPIVPSTSDLEFLIQYAPAQNSMTPPSDGSYASVINAAYVYSPYNGRIIISIDPVDFDIAPLYYADFGLPDISTESKWIPFRSRWRSKTTAELSPWYLVFVPVTQV